MILCDEDMHAYGIKLAEEQNRSSVRLAIGSLYRMLARMLDACLIEERPPNSRARGHELKRKYYRVTQLGRAVARAEARRLRDVVEAAAARNLVKLPRWR